MTKQNIYLVLGYEEYPEEELTPLILKGVHEFEIKFHQKGPSIHISTEGKTDWRMLREDKIKGVAILSQIEEGEMALEFCFSVAWNASIGVCENCFVKEKKCVKLHHFIGSIINFRCPRLEEALF